MFTLLKIKRDAKAKLDNMLQVKTVDFTDKIESLPPYESGYLSGLIVGMEQREKGMNKQGEYLQDGTIEPIGEKSYLQKVDGKWRIMIQVEQYDIETA